MREMSLQGHDDFVVTSCGYLYGLRQRRPEDLQAALIQLTAGKAAG